MILFTTLYDEKNYVLHYLNLKQALKAGLKLEKIHRVIKFDQSDWMRVYIEKNTKLRQEAKNDCEKDFFKLMNNSVFGRTMMNVRKHVDIKLISEGNIPNMFQNQILRSQRSLIKILQLYT